MIKSPRSLAATLLLGVFASFVFAQNPGDKEAVIFSGESVVEYTGKRNALVDSTNPPPDGGKSVRVEFWRPPHSITIGPWRNMDEFSPAQIDWSSQNLVFEYRTTGVPKILSFKILIPVAGNFLEAVVLPNSPDLMNLKIDGQWHTAVVHVSGWQKAFQAALDSGKVPADALVSARLALNVAHNGAINIANFRTAPKDGIPTPNVTLNGTSATLPTPTPTPTPEATPEAAPEPSQESPEVSSLLNDTARFLAGMMPLQDSSLIELAKTPAWQTHAKSFDAAWAKLEEKQLSKVRSWAGTQFPNEHSSNSPVFYMFSGPDFIYANALFPNATTYVMCGMEPVGPTPDFSKIPGNAVGNSLQALRNSLDSVMNFSFFITNEMKTDFQGHSLTGTLPILYIFLARSGKAITNIDHVSLDADGNVSELQDENNLVKSAAQGVRIRFLTEGSKTPQTLYFFSTDISDGGLAKSGFTKFCNSLAPANSFIKSASYLMHKGHFSNIRTYLLANSSTLVQDDSGIPCSFFEPEKWTLQVHGSYPGPIPLFKDFYQAKLAELYRTSKPTPLDFGIGYRHRAGESTLIVATRRPDPVTNASQSASELAKQ